MSKIKSNKIKSKYTYQELWEMLSKMYEDKNKESHSKIVIYQGCKTNGTVSRSGLDLNLCNDPTCPSCNMFNELLEEEAKNFLNENT